MNICFLTFSKVKYAKVRKRAALKMNFFSSPFLKGEQFNASVPKLSPEQKRRA